MFSCEFCEISKNIFFQGTPLVATSEYFVFVHLLLIEDYEEGALRKDLTIAASVEKLKTATLRKSYSYISFLLTPVGLRI